MKITVLDGYTLNPGDLSWDLIAKLGELTIYDRTSEDKIISRIGESETIFTNKTPIDAKTMDACPNLKFIGVLATGYNVIDIDEAKARGIVVCNVPEYSTQSVAEYVFALMLEAAHNVGSHSSAVKNGEWAKSPDFCFLKHPVFELSGKTLGIIGYGRIGRATAKIAHVFGMKVIAYSRSLKVGGYTEGTAHVTLDEVYTQSDIISLHVPLFPETNRMINTDSIAKCKDGVVFINTARGAVVDEDDVSSALISGKVAYFAADVAQNEPINEDSPLLSAPNVILTPHIAWATKEARARLMQTACMNLIAFIEGAPINVVS